MSSRDSAGQQRSGAYWVAGALFVFAVVVLAAQPFPFTSPVSPAVVVPAWVTDTTPVRHPEMKPEYRHAVFVYRCSDCHDIIPSPPETERVLTQHSEIVLKHGMNARCFNCHHRTNRDAFVDDQGGEIPWDHPERMCAKCHGPVYRDWQHGVHGRTNGYWLVSKGPRKRLTCVRCHDPHQPPFPPMHPAPGPHTLRMGRQDFPDYTGEHDPLRVLRSQYRQSVGEAREGN